MTSDTPRNGSGAGARAAPARSFALYLAGLASWFASLGLQMVLFPYLVAIELGESPERVGLAQAALMAPSLLFMMFGGAFADRRDTRAVLIRIHCAAALPPLALVAVIVMDALSYPWIIGYALAMGTLSAFAMPARDSLLSRVVESLPGTDMQRAVTLASGVQFIGQLAGILTAGAAALTGAPALLALQAVIMLTGGATVARLAPAPPIARPHAHPLTDIREGIIEVARSPVLLPVVLAMFAVGILYVGTFMVLLPLLVRDYYGGGASALSVVNVSFWGGTILATFVLLRFGHIHRRGRVLAGALASGAVILALIGVPAPFWVMCLLCFAWGLGAGTSMTMSRTIVQLAAPPSHRARILSIFQLGFAGGGPIGAVLSGYVVSATDVHMAAWIPAAIMVVVLAAMAARTRLLYITSADVAGAGEAPQAAEAAG